LHSIPSNDEAWEAREIKFHDENVKQINDLIRRMNTLAPSVARRAVISRETELSNIRGDLLRSEVWSEIQKRANEAAAMPQNKRSKIYDSPYYIESQSLQKLRNVASRSLLMLSQPMRAIVGKGMVSGVQDGRHRGSTSGAADQTSDGHHDDLSGFGLILVAGVGLGAIVYFRRPTRNDSLPEIDLIPVQSRPKLSSSNPSHIVATSPAEPRLGPIGFVKLYILEPFLTVLRFFHLAILFGPVIITSPMLLVGKPERRKRTGKPVAEAEENWGAVWWYGFLVKQMERAGPSFIKLGQWAASRADIFPAVLCDLMSKLHSNGVPHSLHHTKKIIEKAFGLRFDDIFEDFGNDPIGCGAIAQVYKAKLRPEVITGDDSAPPSAKALSEDDDLEISPFVAIKVLHPRVAKTIRRDIAIMSVFANIVNAFPGMQWISLPEEVEVFGQMMNSQLDLRVEAANLDRFDRNFRSRGPRVTFPRPIKLGFNGHGEDKEESREVLVEEYEDALPLKWFLQNGGGPYDDKIANIGLDAFLVSLQHRASLIVQEMLLLDNWTHGDLHP